MLQDIAPFQFKNQYHCAKPCGEDRAIIVRDDMVLMKTTGNELAFPQFCELDGKEYHHNGYKRIVLCRMGCPQRHENRK